MKYISLIQFLPTINLALPPNPLSLYADHCEFIISRSWYANTIYLKSKQTETDYNPTTLIKNTMAK